MRIASVSAFVLVGVLLRVVSTAAALPSVAASPLQWVAGAHNASYESVRIQVPASYASQSTSNATSASFPLYMYRLVGAAATRATAPTVVLVADTSPTDTYDLLTVMQRIVKQAGTDVNVYALENRLFAPSPGTLRDNDLDVEWPAELPCSAFTMRFHNVLTIDDAMRSGLRACHDWLRLQFGPTGAGVFSLDNASRDLTLQLRLLQHHEQLQTNPKVYLLAIGQASRVVERYLALRLDLDLDADTVNGTTTPPAPFAGFIFDTPYAMNVTASTDKTTGDATDRVLDGCDADEICSRNFATLGVSPRDVLKQTLRVLDKKTLKSMVTPCARSLADAAFESERDLAPSHGVRRFVAALRRQPRLARLLPVLLFRLQRCNAQDEALLATLWSGLWDELQIRMSTDLEDDRTAFERFVANVVSFSELWPSPQLELSWSELVDAFEATQLSDGAMVAMQPAYCAYTGSPTTSCAALYTSPLTVDASLAVTYPRSSVAPVAEDDVGWVSGVATRDADVLVLVSRLSTTGSMAVAKELFDAVVAGGTASSERTTLLVASDNLDDTEIRIRTTVVDAEIGANGFPLEDDAAATDATFQLLGLFLQGKLQRVSGAWHARDLQSLLTGSTNDRPTISTYATAPVVLNMTLSEYERRMWFPDSSDDLYATELTAVSGSAGGSRPWHVAVIVIGVVAGATVLLLVFCCVRRKRRAAAAADDDAMASP